MRGIRLFIFVGEQDPFFDLKFSFFIDSLLSFGGGSQISKARLSTDPCKVCHIRLRLPVLANLRLLFAYSY